jgi:hypothetical protein
MFHQQKERVMTRIFRSPAIPPAICLFLAFCAAVSAQQRSTRPQPPPPSIVVISQSEYDSLVYYPAPRTLMAADKIRNHELVQTTYYYRTGEVLARLYYADGLQVENEEWYWRNGKVQHIIPFRSGMPHGIAYAFDAAGSVIDSTLYIEGRRNGFERYPENFSGRESLAGR